MTIIRTTCPSCGEVDIGADAVVLEVLDDNSRGIYSFVCPSCRQDVEKWADRKAVALLVSAGVDVEEGRRPANGGPFEDEWMRGEGVPDGPAFTLDDVIDFHFLLEDDRYIEESLSTPA
jgi:hypothetical protein